MFTVYKFFRKEYPDEDACLRKVLRIVLGEDTECPTCLAVNSLRKVKNRRCFQCTKCRHQVYPCKGTIFEKSTTPLTYWFFAIFLFTKSKNGLSACELQRQLGVTYKTAYRMLKQIRLSIIQESFKLSGEVEVDETFVGGLNKNRHFDKKTPQSQGRSTVDKTPVFGIYHRPSSSVRAFAVCDSSAASLLPLIHSNIRGRSHIMSDEWTVYNSLYRRYSHSKVYHASKEYVNGEVTTNRIENFWSVFKRTIKGSYIYVSKKHLQMYVNEAVFRFNNRKNPLIFERLLLFASCSTELS